MHNAHIALVDFFGRIHEHDTDVANDAMLAAVAETKGILVCNDHAGYGQTAWLLHFGAYGDTLVLAWGRLEDALEGAAGVLPMGMFCTDSVTEEYVLAMANATAVHALLSAFGLAEGLGTCDINEWADEQATIDCTYTESGYLPSWEWGCSIEGVTLADLADLADMEDK